MQYITSEVVRPRYKIWPLFLDRMNLSIEAKKIYVDLLYLSFMSQYKGDKWIDKEGRVFVRCSIAEVGKMIGRKERVAKDYLKELDDAGLILRKRNWSASSTIYVGYPDSEELFSYQSGEKLPDCNNGEAKNCPIVGRKTAPSSGGKPPTNLLIQSRLNTESMDATASPAPKKFKRPDLEEAKAYFAEKGSTDTEAENFIDYHDSNGWKVGKAPMKDWKAAARRWIRNVDEWHPKKTPARPTEKEYKRLGV